MRTKTFSVCPTWEVATQIYIDCLLNPKSSDLGKQGAKEDLMRLARSYDMAIKLLKSKKLV